MTASVIPILRPRRVKGDRDVRALCGLFPTARGRRSGIYLYAFGLDDGIVKIGVTTYPRERFMQHIRIFGERMVWTHLFGTVPGRLVARAVERAAHERAAAVGERIAGTEFFSGLTKPQVLDCVRASIARSR